MRADRTGGSGRGSLRWDLLQICEVLGGLAFHGVFEDPVKIEIELRCQCFSRFADFLNERVNHGWGRSGSRAESTGDRFGILA